MTQEAAELLKRALALPAEERADLASTLIDSLDATVDENVEAAWQEEISRRMEDLASGRVKPVSLEEFRRRLSSAAE
jgi:putative addiction module component (TIGR02574 family)